MSPAPSPPPGEDRPDVAPTLAGTDVEAGCTHAGREGGTVADPGTPERREFLKALTLGIAVASGTALLVPWTALLLTPAARRDPGEWREVGPVEAFTPGETRQVTYLDADALPWAGYVARNTAWIRQDDAGEFTAFTAYCSHVGCPIRWEQGAELFLCPCHGGAFHADGSVASGPPPRPLDRYPVRVRNGVVELLAVGMPRSG